MHQDDDATKLVLPMPRQVEQWNCGVSNSTTTPATNRTREMRVSGGGDIYIGGGA